MARYVEITFDCMPLRAVGSREIPDDASPKFRAKCERIQGAIAKHGAYNAFYLHNAKCAYHLTNDEQFALLEFAFEGTVLTDELDRHAVQAHLDVELLRETCDWLTEPIVRFFAETVIKSVMVEFDRYIAAGDLQKAVERVERINAEAETQGGYLGMYL